MRIARLCEDRMRRVREPDRGQITIEFTGMLPIIIVTLIAIWQMVLIGYTFSLAGNSADEAARAYAVTDGWTRGEECDKAGRKNLPAAWDSEARIDCPAIDTGVQTDLDTVDVRLKVPVLFPGTLNWFFPVEAHASAAKEANG
ncbi:TadE/TadG family type IV pilus assembly protein [Streptomyces sp. NPDC056682]|uniref:TadE/TadG family type IV pilus assembly protein n=1 Tax=Streptomyces sp. NPDC056682 TaxID=3345909 RepID=UPI003691DCC2